MCKCSRHLKKGKGSHPAGKMARIVLSAVIALVILVQGITATTLESVAFYGNERSCPNELGNAKKSLVFVFESFSFGQLAKATGAFEETPGGQCAQCTLRKTRGSLEKLSTVCPISLQSGNSDTSEVAKQLEAKLDKDSRVVYLSIPFHKISSQDDARISKEIEDVLAVSNGDIEIVFAGRSKAEWESMSRVRNLQSGDDSSLLIRMAPDTFIGLVLLVTTHVLLIFFLCCCMDGILIQTKYAKQYPLRGKEFN